MTNPINGTGYDLGILYATRPRVPLPSSGSILFEADARIGDVQGVMDLEHLGKCEVSRTGREAVFNFTMSEEMKIKLTPWRQIPLRNLFIFLSASHKRLFAHLRGFPNPWDASIATFYPQARVARIDMKEFPLSYLVRGLKGKPTGEIKLKDVTIRSRFSFNTNTTAAKIAKVRDTKVVSKKDNNSTPRVKSVIRTTAKGRVDLSPMAYMFNSLKNFTDVRARFRATDKGIKLRAYLGHGIDLVPRLLELEDPEFHVTRRITNKTRTEVKLFGSVELLDTLSDVTILFKNFRSILKTNITFGENYSTKIVGASRYARKDSKEFQDDFQLRASFSKNFLEFLSNKIAKIVRRNVKRYHGVPTSKRYEKMLQKTDRALNRGRARLADLKKRLATGETARMQRLRLLIAKKKANIAKIQAKISFTQNHEQRHLKSNQAMLNGNMTRLQESIFKLKASREKALAELNRIMSQTTKTGSQNSDRIAKLHAKIAELKGQKTGKTGKTGKNVPVSQAKIDKVKAKLAKLRASLAEKANNNKKPVQQTGAQNKLQDKINKIEAKLAKYRASNPSKALKALLKVIAALRKQGLGSQSKLRPARALALSKVQKIQAALIRLTAKTAQIPKLTNELVQLQKKNEQLKNEIYAAKNNKAGPQKTGEAQLLLVKLAESEALVTKINRAATKLEKVKAQISKITKAIGKLPAPKKPSKDTKISKDVLKSQIAGVNSELKTLKRKHNLSKSSDANVAEYDAKIKKVAEKIQALEKSSTTTINVSDLQKQLARLQHRKARTIKIRDQRAQLKNSIAKLKDLINKIKTGAAISDDHEKELLVADKIQAQTKLHKALLTLAKLPQMQSALAAMKSKPNPQNQKQIPKLEATISKVQKLASAEKPLREKIASLDKKIKKFQSSGVSKQQARLAATKSKLQVKLTIHNNAIAKKQRVEKELSKVRTRLGAYLNPNTLSSTHKSKLDKLRTALQQVEALRPKAQQLRTQIDQVNQQIIQASGKVSLNIFRKLAHASSNVVKQAQLAQLEAKYAKVKNIDQSIAKLNGEINVVKQKLEKSRKAKFFNIILKMKIPILTIKLRKLESRKAVEVAVKNSMGVIKAQIDKLRGELRTSQPNQAAAGNLPALKSEKSKLEAQLANVNKAISKIDKMKSEIAKVNVHVIAKVSVDAKHQRWKNVMLKLEEAVRRIANHEKNAHLIEKRIRAIDAELKLLANKKPKISDLMGKLSKLEQKLKDVEKEERGIDKLEKQIQNVQSAITNAKGAASVQVASKSQISTLKIRLNELYKRRAIVVDRKKHSRKHKEAKLKLMAKLRGLLSLLKKHLEKDLAKLQKLVGKLAATKKVVEETKQKLKQMGMNDQVKLVKLKQMLEVNKAAIRRKNTKLVRLGALKLKIEKLKAKVAKIQPKLESKRGVNPNVSKLNEKLAFEEKNAQKLKSKIAKMLKLKQQIKVLKTKLIASGGKPITSVEAIKSKIAKLEAFLANPNRKSGRGGRTTTDAKQKIRALKAKIEKLSKAGTSDKVKALKRTIQKIDKQLMRKNARFVKTDSKMRTKPRFAIHDERAIHALQAAMTTIQAKVKKAEKKLQILMKHISKKMIVGGQALKDKLAKKLNAKIAKIERRIDRLQALKSKVLGKGVLDAAKMNHLVVTRIIGSTTLSELTRTGKFAQAQVFISIGKSQVRITTSLNPKYPGRFVRRVLRKAIRKILRSL